MQTGALTLPRGERGPCLIQAYAYRSSHAVSVCSAGRPGTSGATADCRGEGAASADAGGAAMASRTWRRPGKRAGSLARYGLRAPQGHAASLGKGPGLNTNSAAQKPWKKKINKHLFDTVILIHTVDGPPPHHSGPGDEDGDR